MKENISQSSPQQLEHHLESDRQSSFLAGFKTPFGRLAEWGGEIGVLPKAETKSRKEKDAGRHGYQPYKIIYLSAAIFKPAA